MKFLQAILLSAVFLGVVACGDGEDGTESILGEGNCEDNIRNQDEEDVDCGGVCSACPEATCSDGIHNGDEDGTDCGGACAPCETETCTDRALNGQETGIDCGGPDCPACVDPTCDDGLQNGSETGIDCGGAECDLCSTCSDGVQNQDEEGVDCGGIQCEACDDGSGDCSDGILNGDEAGVDCGGSCDTACNLGQGDSCIRSDDACGTDTTCTNIAEIDEGSAKSGICRMLGCTPNTSDCGDVARCVQVKERLGDEAYRVTQNPADSNTTTTACTQTPEDESEWILNVDSVVVSQDFGGLENPDILVCFGPPRVHNDFIWSNMHCVYDEDQYDGYAATDIGSVTYVFAELEELGVYVLDDDGLTGFSGFESADFVHDDEIANGTFNLQPAGRIRAGERHTLFGTGSEFFEDNGLISIQVSISPASE